MLSVGKKTEQTSVLMRTDAPVWEQGYTFLVPNPENDTLQMKIIDQKTTNEIGKFTYIIAHLMDKPNMEIVNQPFQLQKSGPESKIVMALSLRILKRSQPVLDDETDNKDSLEDAKEEAPKSPLKKQDSRISRTSVNAASDAGSVEEPLVPSSVSSNLAVPPSPTASRSSEKSASSLERTQSVKSFTGEVGSLGAINMTIQYSIQRQRLIIVCIHQCEILKLITIQIFF